jgi:nitrate/nitrite transporter NarK
LSLLRPCPPERDPTKCGSKGVTCLGTSARLGDLINSIGSISGFVGPTFYGLMKDLTGSSNGAMYLFALLGALGGFLALLIPVQLVKR